MIPVDDISIKLGGQQQVPYSTTVQYNRILDNKNVNTNFCSTTYPTNAALQGQIK